MLAELRQPLENLERRKSDLLAELANLPVSQTNLRPTPQSWSMLDVADHLMKVEAAFVESAQRSLAGATPPVTLRESIGALVVRGVMLTPMRVRTPGGAEQVTPQHNADLAQLAREWDVVRAGMREQVERVAQDRRRCGVFRHPVSGMQTMRQALHFLDAHFVHHGFQLDRLRRSQAGM